MKKMPGMMMISETRKNQLRRLTMSSFRTRGSRRDGGSETVSTLVSSGATSSFGAASSSEGSSTVHPSQPRPPKGSGRQDDREQVVSDDDGRDQAGDDTDRQCDREALDLRRPDEAEDDAGDEGRGVGIADSGPGAADGRINRRRYGAAGPDLLFETLEDQDVGVDSHTHGQDEARDAGEGQRHRYQLEDGQYGGRIEEEGDAGQ